MWSELTVFGSRFYLSMVIHWLSAQNRTCFHFGVCHGDREWGVVLLG